MSTTRRQVLLQGGAMGAGIIASNLPGMTALAQGQLPQRRALDGLAWNDPIVATYRDAVGIMKKMPPSQQFSWVNLAMIHGTDPDTYHYCPHGNWYFLPWHRAFTTMYERIVRQLTNNNDFALPYWDWTANPLMPDVFLTPKTPDGKPNPLYNSDAGWQRTWPSNQPMPAETVGPTVLNAILSATEYEQFATSRPEGQNSLDASWITTGSGTQDQLEGNAHNMVHNNIGGWMPSASSPRDPIFFMHHCNIDRIWALWNVQNPNSSDQLWTDMPFTENFYSVDGSFWSPKVSDLYVPENLGYTYGLSTSSLVAAGTAQQVDHTVCRTQADGSQCRWHHHRRRHQHVGSDPKPPVGYRRDGPSRSPGGGCPRHAGWLGCGKHEFRRRTGTIRVGYPCAGIPARCHGDESPYHHVSGLHRSEQSVGKHADYRSKLRRHVRHFP
jgi:tyrosinase